MNKQLIEELKGKLEKEKKEIEDSLKGFANKDDKLKDDWDTRFPKWEAGTGHADLESASDQVEEYGNLLSVEHNLEIQLKDINLALEKIRKDAFGKCETCNQEIPEERLKAFSAARLCMECEKK
ncbi:MAG: TraR/DksA C4-type zinc finger protein [Candidatus Nealsonbacteria bacterium]